MAEIYPGQVELLKLNHQQITALASVACTEVFSTISPSHPLAIREIAHELGKSPASVGEHIATLLDVELIIPAGDRKRRSRTETLYVTKGKITKMFLREHPWETVVEYLSRFRGQMRLAERQFEKAQKALHLDHEFQAFLFYRWSRAYLSRENSLLVKEKVAELHALVEELSEPNPDSENENELVHLNFSSLILPSQRESQKVIDEHESQ